MGVLVPLLHTCTCRESTDSLINEYVPASYTYSTCTGAHANLHSSTGRSGSCLVSNCQLCLQGCTHTCTYVYTYCISSNRRPSVYFLCDSADPVFKQGRRLFTSRISCPRPPMLRSARQGRNSLQFVLLYKPPGTTSTAGRGSKPRERQAHLIAFYLKAR